MVDVKEQNDIFGLIGRKLKRKIECFVIGGSAMMYYNVKENTKDIDVVFLNEKDRMEIENILRKEDFTERNTRFLYHRKKNVPILLQKYDMRFDLFLRDIICFWLSDEMIERVEKVYEFGDLIVKVVSLEDIVLLKCATERAGDRADVKEIIEKVGIKWDVITEEVVRQTKDREIFSVFLYDFLMELKEDLKVDIPKEVIKKVRTIGEREMVKRLGK